MLNNLFFCTFLFLGSINNFTPKKYDYYLSIGMLFSILCLILINLVLFGMEVNFLRTKEDFFFEVSPNRAACLKKQVSRNPCERSCGTGCGCCGRGTVGGIPPVYQEWLDVDPDTGSNWHRPDGVVTKATGSFSNGTETVCNACGPPAYINYIDGTIVNAS